MPSLSRRHALAGGFCLCCLPAALRAAAATAGTGPFATEEVAPGLHIRRGIDQDASAGNDDAIANIGFIIGREAVLVADPGGSLADGERLRASIREKTDLPIRYVAMSHVHPDHIFGAGAFRQDDPVFIGHARLVPALAQRGAFYQKGLESDPRARQGGARGDADHDGRRPCRGRSRRPRYRPDGAWAGPYGQ